MSEAGLSSTAERLDTGGLQAVLLQGLTGALGDLDRAQPPAAGSAGTEAASLDLAGVSGAIDRTAGALRGVTGGALPDVGAALAPLGRTLTLAEMVTGGALWAELAQLRDELGRNLDGPPAGGLIEVLGRLPGLFSRAQNLKQVLDLLGGALRGAGVDLRPAAGFGEVVPAVANSVRAFGVLMGLETSLGEAERLTTIMSSQLTPAELAAALGLVKGAYESARQQLAAAATELPTATPERIEAVTAEVLKAAAALQQGLGEINRGMGFGEATLVHVDLRRLQDEVRAAGNELRAVDTQLIGRVVAGLVDRVRPTFQVDLVAPVAQGIDGVLTFLEGRTAEIAAGIATVDLSPVAEPVRQGLGQVTGALSAVSGALEDVQRALRAALESVRQAVAAVPLDDIIAAVKAILDRVTAAIDGVRAVVDRIGEGLTIAANTAKTGILAAEKAIDDFKREIDGRLAQAADFIEGLHLDQVVGEVTDKVNAFAQELGRVQLRPYFDTAVEVVGTTADVVDALPLSLLPDDALNKLKDAARPIKAIDLPALETEVEGWFQITPDGKFGLRATLEEALADIQEKVGQVLAAVESADPRRLIAPIDTELAKVRGKIEELEPAVTLAPIQEAIDRVKGLLGGFDLRAALRPITEAFATVITWIEEHDPSRLVAPYEERLRQVRTQVTNAIKLDAWVPTLDGLIAQGQGFLDQLDPTRLEPLLRQAMAELRALVGRADAFDPWASIGDLVAALFAGSGRAMHPFTFRVVVGWLLGDAGAAALAGRAARIAGAVAATQGAVAGTNVAAVAAEVNRTFGDMRALVAALPAGSAARVALEAALGRVEPAQALAELEANRARYQAGLEEAARQVEAVRGMGLSQVDVSVNALVAAASPGRVLRDLVGKLLGQLGLGDLTRGVRGVVDRLVAAATPERLAGVLVPVFTALRARVTALVETIITPVRAGIVELQRIVAAFDLAPLREGLAGVVAEVVGQIRRISPEEILRPQLIAVDALKAALLAFDPLAPVREVVEAFKAAALRVLGKLDAAKLLENPTRIYDEILAAVRAVRVDELARPILDALDDLAGQVDDGLDRTTTALGRLQEALP